MNIFYYFLKFKEISENYPNSSLYSKKSLTQAHRSTKLFSKLSTRTLQGEMCVGKCFDRKNVEKFVGHAFNE